MKLLCIADLHFYQSSELRQIQTLDYDACALLGDIPAEAICEIKQCNGLKPIFGVAGNHDEPDILQIESIEDLHCKKTDILGITIAGFSGSSRYKLGNYAMFSQKESIVEEKRCPPCDVLISHDTVYKGFSCADSAHVGLKGITRYIKKNKIRLNICGHYHRHMELMKHGCKIICVYRCALIDLPSAKTTEIF